MSQLPVPISSDDRPSHQLARAAEAQARPELAIFEHSLRARFEAECERIDAEALSDVIKCALAEEFSVLDEWLPKCGGSAAKAELVARMVAMQSEINNRRISRRFGG